MGLEGLVSKHRDRPYRGGRQKHWIKVKNRSHPAMTEAEKVGLGLPLNARVVEYHEEREYLVERRLLGSVKVLRRCPPIT
jgi:hypothetical protein